MNSKKGELFSQKSKRMRATGIILAGGKGTRFGENKAFIKINHRCLMEYIIDIFKDYFNEIIISTNNPSNYQFKGVKTVQDIIPHQGPLLGIYSAMMQSRNYFNFVSACDMPFIKTSLIDHMIEKSEGYDVVVPSLREGLFEPLHALYTQSCLCSMKKAIDSKKTRVISFYPDVNVYRMQREEIILFDPDLTSFFNINTHDDLKKAESLFRDYFEKSRKSIVK